jgi:hypothetical protein
MKWLAALLDRFLDRIAPLPDQSFWLPDIEADLDVWEPFECPGDTTREGGAPLHVTGMVPGSPDLAPAGTDSRISAAVGSGGHTTDEQRIQELVADYESFLRDLFRS